VAEDRAHNPRLNARIDEAAFVQLMDGLALAHPKRIHEALPANMLCGLRENGSDDPGRGSFQEIAPVRADLSAIRRVIDVRSPEEFEGELGHLPGAALIPLAKLAERASAWPRTESILVVCRSGRRSYQACSLLAEMGFLDVNNLAGGMVAWREQQEVASC